MNKSNIRTWQANTITGWLEPENPAPPYWKLAPASCTCGGNWAWLQSNDLSLWKMHGCACCSIIKIDKHTKIYDELFINSSEFLIIVKNMILEILSSLKIKATVLITPVAGAKNKTSMAIIPKDINPILVCQRDRMFLINNATLRILWKNTEINLSDPKCIEKIKALIELEFVGLNDRLNLNFI